MQAGLAIQNNTGGAQIKRANLSQGYGTWDFSAYLLSEANINRSTGGGDMRILLLEDDAPLCLVYKECLEAFDHEVFDCATLERATTVLRTQKIDLLVLDLIIGSTNSLAFAQYAGYAAPDAEIILITGSNFFANGELMSICPGINWVLRKPLPLSDLEAFVEHAGHRRSEQTVARLT